MNQEKRPETCSEAEDNEPFVIRGGQIYKHAIEQHLVDRVSLPRVHTEIDGDTYFEDLDLDSWKLHT